MSSYDKDKTNLQARLSRIEGQVRGLQRMIEDDKYCIDILTQVSSVLAATQKVGMIILDDHIRGCVRDAVKKDDAEIYIKELIQVLDRFMK